MNGRTRPAGRVSPDGQGVRGPGGLPLLASVVSALVVLGPGLRPGYLLVRDMVFVPDPPLTGRLWGIGHENPRAVPSDLVVALLSHVAPGDVVQKTVLLAILLAAGTGAARLAPRRAMAGTAAALVAIWNPYVGERLAMGQWALLVGYAALPWVIAGVTGVARGERSTASRLVAALVLGSLGGGLAWLTLAVATVATVAAVGVATRQRAEAWARARWVLALGVVLALPWAVPALLRPHPVASDPAGFSVFAPGADTPFGVIGSLVTGGGSWNDQVVPPGRDTVLGGVAALLLLGWSAAGFLLTRRTPDGAIGAAATAYRPAVLASGGAGLSLGLLSAWPALLEPLARVPGGGLLRDGSRQLGPWVLLLAVGAGWAVHWLAGRGMPRAAPALAALLPVAVLPALGWGLSGLFAPVAYPSGVQSAAAALAASKQPGSVVVLPFQAYRRYPWDEGTTSLTPWPRVLDRRVVVSSDLVVATSAGERTVAGEDAYAARVRAALAGPHPAAALMAAGVGWLVVDLPGTPVPPGAALVLSAPGVDLYRLGGGADGSVAATSSGQDDPPALGVLLGDLLWLGGVGTAVLVTTRRSRALGTVLPAPTIG